MIAEESRKALPYLSLFTSTSTLICCALPALFVGLGMGAVFAGLISVFPQMIWMSENKDILFTVAGIVLVFVGLIEYRGRNLPCPINPAAAKTCMATRRFSKIVFRVSLFIYIVGTFFAFGGRFLA